MNSKKELFARLFVIAFQNKINLLSFSNNLINSELLNEIERSEYSDYFNKSLVDIFYNITGNNVGVDNSYGVFNDAYWCGYSYYELHLRTKKPFAYIFLKLPLTKMVDIYSIYHEMDFSSLLEYFTKLSKDKTILRLLCENNKISLRKLSFYTGISLATLSKYNSDDEILYKASFQNIIKISQLFDVPNVLFIQRISGKQLSKNYIEIFGDNYFDYYTKTRVACRGILIRDNDILLSYEKNTDTWMIPGGGLENNESELECVIRELSEETGYVVKPNICALEIDEYYENERFINKYYFCDIKEQKETKLTEVEIANGLRFQWVPINQAIDIFSKYHRYSKTNEMKRGLYLREYSALRRIIQNK